MNCPSCGHENPEHAKFCLECANRVDPLCQTSVLWFKSPSPLMRVSLVDHGCGALSLWLHGQAVFVAAKRGERHRGHLGIRVDDSLGLCGVLLGQSCEIGLGVNA